MMAGRGCGLVGATCILVGLLVSCPQAAERPADLKDAYRFEIKPKAAIADHSKLPTESVDPVIHKSSAAELSSLGMADTDPIAKGYSFGFTWHDVQQHSTMHRQVGWRAGNDHTNMIHFGWTFAPISDMSVEPGLLTAAYYAWNPYSGTAPLPVGCCVFDYISYRSSFPSLDVRPPADPGNTDHLSSVVIGMNRNAEMGSTEEFTYLAYDDAEYQLGICEFTNSGAIRQITETDETPYDPITCEGAHYIWPKTEYHISGADTFTYALVMPNCAQKPLVFFRTPGTMGSSTWESELITDETTFPVHTLTASRVSRKVAVFYIYGPEPGDTSAVPGDVFIRESTNMGAPGSWGGEWNITGYDWQAPGYRAYLEGAVLYSQPDDNLHVLWPAFYTDAVDPLSVNFPCRIFHWWDPNGDITTVHAADWDPSETCGDLSYNSLNVRAVNISQCNNKLYSIWVQAQNPPEIVDNCANKDGISRFDAAVGDIYLSISTDLSGNAWDPARNLTNTHSTAFDGSPCDSAECYSENWPSVSRYGMNMADFGGADAVPEEALEVQPDPGGVYTGDWYLDVMYVEDKFPGWSTGGIEDTKKCRNPIRWFRIPCVDVMEQANPLLSPKSVEYPYYLKHGSSATIPVEVMNTGTSPLVGTVRKVENVAASSVPTTDWLDFDVASFNLGVGGNNMDTMNVFLNVGGLINDPGTVVSLVGCVVIDIDEPTTRDSVSFDVELLIADTLVGITYDTIVTDMMRLAVSNNGNMGQGGGRDGTVNMDFVWSGIDCDTQPPSEDTIPGNSRVYLNDASPFVLREVYPDSIVGSWSVFNRDLASPHSFKPIVTDDPFDRKSGLLQDWLVGPEYGAYWSGWFVTSDSALTLEHTIYFPKSSSKGWMLSRVALWSTDGSAVSGIVPGFIWDWDIPSDTGVMNRAIAYPIPNDQGPAIMVYGGEWWQDHVGCTANDRRWGGVRFLGYEDGATGGLNTPLEPHSFHAASNDSAVYREGDLVVSELWDRIQTSSGMTTPGNATDLHVVLAPFDSYSLAANDTLVLWVAMATMYDSELTDVLSVLAEARDYLIARYPLPGVPGCCGYPDDHLTGDFDRDPENIKALEDILRFASYAYLGGPAPACLADGNVDGEVDEEDGSCPIDLQDILALAYYAYLGGDPPAQCMRECE